nr:branched-chain amino acid ABC transporter ATP-binding protein/permease [Bordetella sp. BOR01]
MAAAYLLVAAWVSNPYVLLIMTLVPLWATLGASWNTFSGYSGLLSFGHAVFFGLGAYAVAISFAQFGLTPWLGLLLAALSGALAGLLVGIPTFKLRGVYFSLAMLAYPLAMLYVFEWLGLQEVTLPMKRENAAAYMQFADPRVYVLLAVVMLVAAVLLQLRISRSRFGLSLLAIKQNEIAAETSGINPFRWKLAALVLSGAIAGLAGGLYAVVLVTVTPHSVFGLLVSAQALIFTMFGGVGWVAGPVIGAAVLLPLGELLSATVGARLPGIQGVLYGLAIILVVLLAPDGILPKLASRYRGGAGRAAVLSAQTVGLSAQASSEPVHPDLRQAPVIMQVAGLSKRFGGLQAVSQVSFQARQGEILGIIGPNGAGKTTLFNLLNGIVHPTAGSVIFEGRELAGLRPFEICRLGVGRTFQVARIFARLSVLENVLVGALSSEPDDRRARERARQALDQVGLGAWADERAGRLTAVQLRLMELARALAMRPRLLLVDEVLAGLGGKEVEQVVEVLTKLRAMGVTQIIIEHTMHAMVRLADRLLVLDHGKVLYVGEPAAVTSEPAVIEAYLGKKWVHHAAH